MARAVVERQPVTLAWTQPRWRRVFALPRLERLGPRVLLAIPILFNLWTLRAETTVVQNLNDSHLHFAMVRWARTQILQGNLFPIDTWFPYLGLGSAQFRHYSSLGHLIAGYISVIAGTTTTYYWSIYLLLALWPLSVFLGARLMGWDRWTAAAAALCAPLLISVVNYGYERDSYTWYGLGLWAQMWGMWLLPIALGLTWRAVRGQGAYWIAALLVALTIASHFFEGYLALLAIGLWAVVSPSQLLPRVGRAILLGLGSLLTAAWVLVPLFQDSRWWPISEYERNSYFNNSFGAPKVLSWLVTGQLYDAGRQPPIVTILVGVGLIVCLLRFRKDERARAAVLLWLSCLLLFFGRPTLGPVLDLLPFGHFLALHRFIMGIHLSGLLLAGIGTVAVGRHVLGLARRAAPRVQPAWATAAAMLLFVVALYPAWSEIAGRDNAEVGDRAVQQIWDSTDGADLQVLIDSIKALGPGRVYAGPRWGWGQDYRVGYVPVFSVLANQDVDTVGFRLRVPSLMSEAEMLFDERNPADYDLFGVRYLLLPADRPPPVNATLLQVRGRHTLWQVDSSGGYFGVVDTIWPPMVEDHGNVATHAIDFVDSTALAQHQYPTVAFAGANAAAPSLPPGVVAHGAAGLVEDEVVSLPDGTFKAQIVASRSATVLLKNSFDPHWRVTVDGVTSRPDMIAPALMGRTVSAGRHSVSFQYVSDQEYPILFAIGLLALLGLRFGPRLVTAYLPVIPMLRAPRREKVRATGDPSTATFQRRLSSYLADVDGSLSAGEALAVHEAVRLYPGTPDALNLVALGGSCDRATMALELGARARREGAVSIVDPGTDDRDTPRDKPIDVLFVDGVDDGDGRRAIELTLNKLADGAVVILHNTAEARHTPLRRCLLGFGPPFRRQRMIQSLLFAEFKPQAAWTAWDAITWVPLRAIIFFRSTVFRFRFMRSR